MHVVNRRKYKTKLYSSRTKTLRLNANIIFIVFSVLHVINSALHGACFSHFLFMPRYFYYFCIAFTHCLWKCNDDDFRADCAKLSNRISTSKCVNEIYMFDRYFEYIRSFIAVDRIESYYFFGGLRRRK